MRQHKTWIPQPKTASGPALRKRAVRLGPWVPGAIRGPRPALSADVVLSLQRSAGNRAVAELMESRPRTVQRTCGCGGRCGGCGDEESRDNDATVQRALPKDLQIWGLYEDRGRHPSQVFFDYASAELDTGERAKIDAFLTSSPPPRVVTAKASEEGSAGANTKLAQRRGEAVAAQLGRSGTKPAVVVNIEDAAGNQDYRFMRRVDMGTPTPKEDRCIVDPNCVKNLEKSLQNAHDLAGEGQAGAASASNKPALRQVFHADTDVVAREVVSRFQGILDELAELAKPGRHVCGTPCTHTTCKSGNRAFLDRPTNTMVACPDLQDGFKTVVETIMHEAVHGTKFQGEDAAYLFEPLFPFLSTNAALQNPDSFVEFTRVLKGRPTAPRSPTGGFDSSFTDDDRRTVDKAVAWAMKHLLESGAGVDNVYRVLAAAQKDPQGAGDLSSIAGERALFKKHFGTTGPSEPSKPEDQWRVNGVSDHVRKLIVTSGQQPEVVRGQGVVWSTKNKRLRVNSRFLQASVSDQARQTVWALILDSPHIPLHRRTGYMSVVDALGGSDLSAAP